MFVYYVQFIMWHDSHFQCQVFSLFLSINNFLCDRKVPHAALGHVLMQCLLQYCNAFQSFNLVMLMIVLLRQHMCM